MTRYTWYYHCSSSSVRNYGTTLQQSTVYHEVTLCLVFVDLRDVGSAAIADLLQRATTLEEKTELLIALSEKHTK